jgi:putative endonuclease
VTKREISEKTEMGKKPYYVYLLLCDDGSYYTGYTSNIASRLERHKKGRGARYTRMRKPKRLVYVEEFGTRDAATRRERQIKALSHREKQELVSFGSRAGKSPMKSPITISRRLL